MTRSASSPNFSEYRTVGEAAAYLGVSAATLRNWDRAGKLKPRRHPQNGYRIYLHADLEAILNSVERKAEGEAPAEPRIDWRMIGESDCFVQFYEQDAFLVESVAEFVGAALVDGRSSVIIATDEHRQAIHRRLSASAIDLSGAITSGRLVSLDALQALPQIMDGDLPDALKFHDTIGKVIARLTSEHQRVHAFGELAALLWSAGNRAGAARLEGLWNELRTTNHFCLLSAYPIANFSSSDDVEDFNRICQCHSGVIPSESYAAAPTLERRLRVIAALQQQAQSLKTEIAHRRQSEQETAPQERTLAAERWESKQPVEEVDRRKIDVLLKLAHDLRGPLEQISLAKQSLHPDSANAEAIETIDRQTLQLERLLDSLVAGLSGVGNDAE